MELKSFSSLYTHRLPINDLYSLCQSTISYAKPVLPELSPVGQAVTAELEAQNNQMGARMNRSQRDALTPAVQLADDNRDACALDLKREIKTASLSRNVAKQEAGQQLLLFLQPYWDFDREALNTETEIIDQIVDSYQASTELLAAAGVIGVDVLFTELSSLNDAFNSLYNQRNAAIAADAGPSAHELKSDVAKMYDQFSTALEQTVSFAPTASLLSLFHRLDALRRSYARLISSGSSEEAEASDSQTAD